MFLTASVDAGNDALKAYIGGLEEENKVYIPNVVKKMEDRPILSLGDDPLAELHLRITSSAINISGTYAVGTLAVKEKDSSHIPATVMKSDSDQTVILALTALAYYAAMNSKAKKVDVEYLLSSGLPVDEVKADRRAAFKEKLVEGTILFLL